MDLLLNCESLPDSPLLSAIGTASSWNYRGMSVTVIYKTFMHVNKYNLHQGATFSVSSDVTATIESIISESPAPMYLYEFLFFVLQLEAFLSFVLFTLSVPLFFCLMQEFGLVLCLDQPLVSFAMTTLLPLIYK